MTSDIGVIGLGVIGYGIALNLRKKISSTATLHVYDVVTAPYDRLLHESRGSGKIEFASSPKDLASKCATVLSSLPSGAAVRDVFLNEATGVIAAPKSADRLFIEHSTIEIETTKEIGTKIMEAGVGHFVDAPVSGGVWGAMGGELTFMIGHPDKAEPDAVGRRVLDVLSLIGLPEKSHFCGGLGMGQVAKIAHNYVSLCNNLVATEGMALGLKYGIDKMALWKCIADGSANSWVMHFEQPVPGIVPEAPSSNDYKRAFGASLGLKDLGIAVECARKVGTQVTAGEVAIRALQRVHDDPRTTGLDHTSLWLHVNGLVDDFEKGQYPPKE